MTQHRRHGLLLGALASFVAASGLSQEKATNLRILPKESSAAEIRDLMEQYNAALGVSCEHCHTRNPTTRQFDYAADDNPAKQTARVMIAMLNDINTRYLAQLDDQRYATLVSCGNCHLGHREPPEFEPAPRALADSQSPSKK
jgi:Photosynthetic reaction centre cytochrome C subunit